MSYFTYVDGEYGDDIATTLGWSEYAVWVDQTRGDDSELLRFVEHGWSQEPADLIADMEGDSPDEPELLSVHEALLESVKRAEEIVQLSDGVNDDPMSQEA